VVQQRSYRSAILTSRQSRLFLFSFCIFSHSSSSLGSVQALFCTSLCQILRFSIVWSVCLDVVITLLRWKKGMHWDRIFCLHFNNLVLAIILHIFSHVKINQNWFYNSFPMNFLKLVVTQLSRTWNDLWLEILKIFVKAGVVLT